MGSVWADEFQGMLPAFIAEAPKAKEIGAVGEGRVFPGKFARRHYFMLGDLAGAVRGSRAYPTDEVVLTELVQQGGRRERSVEADILCSIHYDVLREMSRRITRSAGQDESLPDDPFSVAAAALVPSQEPPARSPEPLAPAPAPAPPPTDPVESAPAGAPPASDPVVSLFEDILAMARRGEIVGTAGTLVLRDQPLAHFSAQGELPVLSDLVTGLAVASSHLVDRVRGIQS